MLKELNTAFAALCSVTATTAQAVEDGSKILRIKGAAAKQTAAIEAIKAIRQAKDGLSDKEIEAAAALLEALED